MNESVVCYECEASFSPQPADFIRYDRWRDAWVTLDEEDGTVLDAGGYCQPCQAQIEATRDIYGGRGTDLIEQRTIEDELFVWDR